LPVRATQKKSIQLWKKKEIFIFTSSRSWNVLWVMSHLVWSWRIGQTTIIQIGRVWHWQLSSFSVMQIRLSLSRNYQITDKNW
jgi:hypothetical protein